MNYRPVLFALVLIASLQAAPLRAAETCKGTPKDDPAVAAFLESKAVAKAVAVRTSHGENPGCVFAVKIGASCGIAGCGASFLVGQTFTSDGANPQTRSVLAQTEIMRPTGKARPARLVKIVPY